MSMLEKDEAFALALHVEHNASTITNALRVFASRMNADADAAMAEFERGKADPEVKATQDRQIVANNGYRVSSLMFRESAEKAQQVADEIDRIIDGDDSPDAGE